MERVWSTVLEIKGIIVRNQTLGGNEYHKILKWAFAQVYPGSH